MKINFVKNEGKEYGGFISIRGDNYSFVVSIANENEASLICQEFDLASLVIKRSLIDKPDYVSQFEWAKAVADQQERLEPFEGEGYPGEEKV